MELELAKLKFIRISSGLKHITGKKFMRFDEFFLKPVFGTHLGRLFFEIDLGFNLKNFYTEMCSGYSKQLWS